MPLIPLFSCWPGQSGREAAANLGAIVASPAWQICGIPGPSILGVDEYYPKPAGCVEQSQCVNHKASLKYPNNVQNSDSQVGFLVRESMESTVTVTQPSVLLNATAFTVNSAPWHIV